MIKLFNTLTRQVAEFKPLKKGQVSIYSCGPTVYDHIHIGNLRAFIMADTLGRVMRLSGLKTTHIMNITDVDDKTIKRSQEEFPGEDSVVALQNLTEKYSQIFFNDMQAIGNDIWSLEFIRATDAASIEAMRQLITDLHSQGFAYVADDGVYFSISKYRESGKKYGQLVNLDPAHSTERINNDEYDKATPSDFALWKKQKAGEPAWNFELEGVDLLGRPGWHIECSAMSQLKLGQPFDIHTGGVDNIFPHHENEIAQSTAGKADVQLARFFVHNEHLLVDGKKMSKSLDNFYVLKDITDKGIDPLAFRLLMLQAHYRSTINFTWESLQAAAQFLARLRAFADLQFQSKGAAKLETYTKQLTTTLNNDLDSPRALAQLSDIIDAPDEPAVKSLQAFLEYLDQALGLQLRERSDISAEQKQLIKERDSARADGDFDRADDIRDKLLSQQIELNDTPVGTRWFRA